jgi:hypothetical protein
MEEEPERLAEDVKQGVDFCKWFFFYFSGVSCEVLLGHFFLWAENAK